MYNAFTLDVESAKKADSEGGRISQTGKYVGRIVRAEFVTSKKGTKGIEVYFEDESKQEMNDTFWHEKEDGTHIFGRDKLNALLTCARVRGLTPKQETVDKYDYDLREKTKQQAWVASELTNVKIGFLVRMEEYENSNYEIKSNPKFVSAFSPADNLMAKEILDKKTTAEALDKAYERLMKSGDKKLKPQAQGYGGAPQVLPQDDVGDLPF